MRKPPVVASGAWSDDIEFDPLTCETEFDRSRHVECGATVGSCPGDCPNLGPDTRGDQRQVIVTELVATRMDRGPEDGRHGGLPQLVAGHAERTGCEPTPARVNADQSPRFASEEDDGAVGGPHRYVAVSQVGRLHIGNRRCRRHGRRRARRLHAVHRDSMALVDHRPRSTRHGSLTRNEARWVDVVRMNITIGAFRRRDEKTLVTDAPVEQRQHVNELWTAVVRLVCRTTNSVERLLEERWNVEIVVIIVSERIGLVGISEEFSDSCRSRTRLIGRRLR